MRCFQGSRNIPAVVVNGQNLICHAVVRGCWYWLKYGYAVFFVEVFTFSAATYADVYVMFSFIFIIFHWILIKIAQCIRDMASIRLKI